MNRHEVIFHLPVPVPPEHPPERIRIPIARRRADGGLVQLVLSAMRGARRIKTYSLDVHATRDMASACTMRVCAGGLLVRQDEILLARRSEGRKFYPGVWDILGGHCEGGETPADTLVRELEEELGVKARAFEEIAVLGEPQLVEYGEAKYHVFLVTAWDGGEPRLLGAEHSELRWMKLDDALAVPLPHPEYGGLLRAVGRRGSARERDI